MLFRILWRKKSKMKIMKNFTKNLKNEKNSQNIVKLQKNTEKVL